MIDLVLEVVTLTYSYFIHIRRRIDRPDFVHATVRQGYSKDIILLYVILWVDMFLTTLPPSFLREPKTLMLRRFKQEFLTPSWDFS